MPKIADVEFQGASGRKHVFEAYTLGTETFNDVGGVYIFTREARNQHGDIKYHPLYIGQTESLRNRLTASHEKWPCAVQNNMDCLCVLVEEKMFSRRAIELDLLSKYNTPCNNGAYA